MTEQARSAFNKRWTEYDPSASGMIDIDNLMELIIDLVFDELEVKAAVGLA